MATVLHMNVMAPLKVLIVSKAGGLIPWAQDMHEGFRALNCPVEIYRFETKSWQGKLSRRKSFFHKKSSVWESPWILDRLLKKVQSYQPSLILFMGVFLLPEGFYASLKSINPVKSCSIIGWVCDCFEKLPWTTYDRLDQVYYFDSYVQEILKSCYSSPVYLPLAVNPKRYYPLENSLEKPPPSPNTMLFVGLCSHNRMALLQPLKSQIPIEIFGPRCRTFWGINLSRRVPIDKIVKLYHTHESVLNIKQLPNTHHGLNLRSFEVTACQRLLFTDYVLDLPSCFDPDQELVVYHDLYDLIEKYRVLDQDPQRRSEIAMAGYQRTLREHTYTHRAHFILKDLGLI